MFRIYLKSVLIFFLVFIFFNSKAISEQVTKIEIFGNERISDETIKIFGDIELNKDLSDNDINLILKNLFNTGFFKDVSLEIKDKILFINVEENPIIETVFLKGVKNKKVRKNLIEKLLLKDKSSFSKTIAKKDAKQIINFLTNLGYFFSDVDVEIEKLDNNFINLTYNITLNDKARLSKIKFIGDKIFKDRKLRNIIISEEYKAWKFLTSKKYLNQEIVNIDRRLLLNFFKNQGYYDAKVQSSYASIDTKEKNAFELIYNIDAGEKFFFDDLKLNISNEYDKSDFKDLDTFLKKIKGEKYSINTIKKILKKIDK